jgi:hypothetical protein
MNWFSIVKKKRNIKLPSKRKKDLVDTGKYYGYGKKTGPSKETIKNQKATKIHMLKTRMSNQILQMIERELMKHLENMKDGIKYAEQRGDLKMVEAQKELISNLENNSPEKIRDKIYDLLVDKFEKEVSENPKVLFSKYKGDKLTDMAVNEVFENGDFYFDIESAKIIEREIIRRRMAY